MIQADNEPTTKAKQKSIGLEKEGTQGITQTTKSQTVFAFKKITVFSSSASSFESSFLNNVKDNKEAGDK